MNTIENEDAKFWVENGLLYSKFKKPIIITSEKAEELIAMRHEISNNKKQYWCYSLNNVNFFTKEARSYVETHGQEFLHGTAAIVNSHIALFIFTVFDKWNNPKIPFQAFTNSKDAVTWLKQLKQQKEK